MFTVHVGDIKSGLAPCTDEAYAKVLEMFGTFDRPLIYTPGDNEWTDCHRFPAGGYDPLERLDRIRRMFFPDPRRSLGRTTLALDTQGARPGFETFVENALWSHGDVVFATLHVVGSNNNLRREAAADSEYTVRTIANLNWANEAFDQAARPDAKGLVLFMQADPAFEKPNARGSGFTELLDLLRRRVPPLGKPVLLVHGDSHIYLVDRPMAGVRGLVRLEVMGAPLVEGVQVTVDPDAAELFEIRPLRVKDPGAD